MKPASRSRATVNRTGRGAIYRYFPSLDALVVELAGDLYDELRKGIEQARDATGDDAVGQLGAMARAFRLWSIQHPVEFALIFGSPLPEMAAFDEDCDDPTHSGARFGAVFLQPFVELWLRSPFPTPPHDLIERRLGSCLEPLRRNYGDLPVEVAYLFLSGWIRLYGLVCMEVFNQLQWAVTEPAALFETELAIFFRQLSADN